MITWEEVPSTVTTLADELIREHHPWLRFFRIGFVFRSEGAQKGGRIAIGNTSKVSPKYSVHLDLDYLIWLAKGEWDRLTTTQRKALIDHELCHIGQEGKLRGHDIEEFGVILKRYGLWTQDLFRLQPVLEEACQLPLDGVTSGGAVAIDPARLPACRNGGTHVIEIDLDKRCARCNAKGTTASGYCVDCEASLKLEGSLPQMIEEMFSE